jgi:hypothetical protein
VNVGLLIQAVPAGPLVVPSPTATVPRSHRATYETPAVDVATDVLSAVEGLDTAYVRHCSTLPQGQRGPSRDARGCGDRPSIDVARLPPAHVELEVRKTAHMMSLGRFLEGSPPTMSEVNLGHPWRECYPIRTSGWSNSSPSPFPPGFLHVPEPRAKRYLRQYRDSPTSVASSG